MPAVLCGYFSYMLCQHVKLLTMTMLTYCHIMFIVHLTLAGYLNKVQFRFKESAARSAGDE